MKQFEQHKALKSENLIVGLENPDDGGVINVGETKIIQTVDFFTPILDSPYDWGRVAAANALSDIYACLLYTSPSPRDGLLSRMPSSA